MEVMKARAQKKQWNFFRTNFIFTLEKKYENKENDRENLNGIK